MVDFNGPTMATDASDAWCLPDQTVADVKGRRIGQVSLAMVDNQTLLAEVVYMMGAAVTIVVLLLPFVLDSDGLEDGFAPFFAGGLIRFSN
jgi:hypothetical protein